MGVVNPPADPASVVQALVCTLLGVFDATRDLYHTLTTKEQRVYEENLRAKGYPVSRRAEYVNDERLGSDEAFVTDKAAVTRQFDIGYQALGAEFAMGDVTVHAALQAQIITLQNVLVTTFLYGPTSNDPVAHQLANMNAASRVAAATAIEILATYQERLLDERPPTPRSLHSFTARSSPSHAPSHAPNHAPSHHSSYAPSHTPSRATSRVRSRAQSQSQAPSRALLPPPSGAGSSTSTALMKYQEPSSRNTHLRSSSPVNTTVLEWRSNLQPENTYTDNSSMSGRSSYATEPAANKLYCAYAYDLQRNPTQPLSNNILSERDPYCPHCQGGLHLSPGKAWEICKWAGDTERTFQVQNRFVVKCHRDGPDGQYCCVICSKYADSDTICGDVKALIKHLSDDHEVRELKHEEDIVEVIEKLDNRRDSGIGRHGSMRGSRSRRSASVASGRRRRSLGGSYEREIDVFDMRSSRR
ncbi:hypothetical protein PTMSG1_08702 [Pyrenophora teres f. maculata]|nr:hypothetical protein PTMSG1_08702 [Pyrenophora teres f. maculata]